MGFGIRVGGDISVIPGNTIPVTEKRPSCRHKVNQVHKRKSFPPLNDGPSFLSAPFFSRLAVGVQSVCFCWVELCGFPSPENLALCLFVSVSEGETNRKTGRQFVCVRKSDGVFSGAVWMVSAEPGWMGSHCLLCLYTKKRFCFSEEQLSFSQKAREHRQPHHCLEGCSPTHNTHTAPSLGLNQCLSPLSNTKVG